MIHAQGHFGEAGSLTVKTLYDEDFVAWPRQQPRRCAKRSAVAGHIAREAHALRIRTHPGDFRDRGSRKSLSPASLSSPAR